MLLTVTLAAVGRTDSRGQHGSSDSSWTTATGAQVRGAHTCVRYLEDETNILGIWGTGGPEGST